VSGDTDVFVHALAAELLRLAYAVGPLATVLASVVALGMALVWVGMLPRRPRTSDRAALLGRAVSARTRIRATACSTAHEPVYDAALRAGERRTS
jgi:hypothetical protein